MSTAEIPGRRRAGRRGTFIDNVVTATRAGRPYKCVYWPGLGRTGPTFRVSLTTGSTETFSFWKEGRADWLFKKAGLTERVHTGDPLFDREVAIASDAPQAVGALLATAEQRAAVGEIFRAGCAWIRLRDGALEAGWEFDANNPPPVASLAAVAGHLVTLAGARNAAPEHPGYSM